MASKFETPTLMIHRNCLLLFLALALLLSCRKPTTTVGKVLAEKHCTQCHQMPSPADLDAASWKLVLDNMGQYLGVPPQNTQSRYVKNNRLKEPVSRIISESNWKALRAYFLEGALRENVPPKESVAQCKLPFQKHSIRLKSPILITSWIQLDPVCRCVRFADAASGYLFEADLKGKIRRRIKVGYGVTGSARIENRTYFVAAKNLMPNDDANGILFTIENNEIKILRSDLIRPVHVAAVKNTEGAPLLAISEFGDSIGRLSLISTKTFERTLVSEKPGYLFAMQEGRDLIVLRAQADEAIVRFTNKEENILRFSPAWGTTSMAWHAENSNKNQIIALTHGDNGDLPGMPYKSVHGVRVYENSQNGWKPKFFYPMPGAYKVMFANFNSDSHPDMAAIAYFTTFAKGESAHFRILEGNGEGFTPCSISEAESGRWITMDVRDVDGDSRADIAMGAAYTPSFGGQTENTQQTLKRPTVMLLTTKPD